MEHLEIWQYVLIATGALFVGIGKGGVPGVGNLTVVLFAMALPPKASVGILLPILISADVFAVAVYRKHTLWPYIVRLAPWVIVGVIAGYLVFSRVDDQQVRVIIGAILLSMTAVHFFRRWQSGRSEGADTLPQHPLFIASTGIMGGFATMVANAAGPVAALYFIASGLPKYAFLGTAAWFFLLVNIFKVPFMVDLGIIDPRSFMFSVSFMVYAVIGAVTAPFLVKLINPKLFEILIWVFVVIGGLKLILP
jgi:uncharacterized membrane protein YfcA